MQTPKPALPTIPAADLTTPVNRLLSIDGGGIKAFVSIAILTRMEEILAARYASQYPDHDRSQFRLAHYFNFIGGTSAGSILAAYLATGASMREVAAEFEDSAKRMFKDAPPWRVPQWRYQRKALANYLKQRFSRDPDREPYLIGDPEVQTLLMIVALNASTGSHWPIFNNPEARYSDLDLPYTNLSFPLWQVIRSSTAAPTFFPPERLPSGPKYGHEFVDGGVCSLNNPSYAMYLQATLPEYHVEMGTGLDKMLLVSVGTGQIKDKYPAGTIEEMHVVESAQLAVQSLMDSSSKLQDIFCRERGCYANHVRQSIDGELGQLGGKGEDFVYLRYNPFLMDSGGKVNPGPGDKPKVVQLDSLREIPYLRQAGEEYAQAGMQEADFPGGALFPNRQGFAPGGLRCGLSVVSASGTLRRLRHFRGDRQAASPNFLTAAEEQALALPKIPRLPEPRQPQAWRFVVSFLVMLAVLGLAWWVNQSCGEWRTAAATYFSQRSVESAGFRLPVLKELTWCVTATTASLFCWGILVNLLYSFKNRRKLLLPSIFSLVTSSLAVVSGFALYQAYRQQEGAENLGAVQGIGWCLLMAMAVGAVISTVFLCWYRRWIAGIPIAGLMLFFFTLAEIFQITLPVGADQVAAGFMLVGLVFAFAGIHLIWWGRPARLVLRYPVGK